MYMPVMVSINSCHHLSSCRRHLLSVLALFIAATILSSTPPTCLLAGADEDRYRLVQTLLTRAAFRSFGKHPRTGRLYNVTLPPGLAGVDAAAVRYRSGSLRRHGARVGEFRLPRGLLVRPYAERLVAVRSNLGDLSSRLYGRYCVAAGYRLVSPVLSLLLYDAAGLLNSSANGTILPPELNITATDQAITVDFSVHGRDGGGRALCAMFEWGGELKLLEYYPRSNTSCAARRSGHFALVAWPAPSTPPPLTSAPRDEVGGEFACRWKVAVAGTVGGLLGATLLGLLCVAFVKERKKREAAEMERRAYEEEVLQVSMIGHVRAPTAAAAARTAPAVVEDDYQLTRR